MESWQTRTAAAVRLSGLARMLAPSGLTPVTGRSTGPSAGATKPRHRQPERLEGARRADPCHARRRPACRARAPRRRRAGDRDHRQAGGRSSGRRGLPCCRVATVVGVGGEGTLRDIATVLRGSGIPLGIIPAGTGNQLAAVLGIPLTLEAAVEALIDARRRTIDLGEVTVTTSDAPARRSLVTIGCGVGFDARIMATTPDTWKRRLGRTSYFVQAFKLAMTSARGLTSSTPSPRRWRGSSPNGRRLWPFWLVKAATGNLAMQHLDASYRLANAILANPVRSRHQIGLRTPLGTRTARWSSSAPGMWTRSPGRRRASDATRERSSPLPDNAGRTLDRLATNPVALRGGVPMNKMIHRRACTSPPIAFAVLLAALTAAPASGQSEQFPLEEGFPAKRICRARAISTLCSW
jgi:Diacylglycerol kinase catalytic domain